MAAGPALPLEVVSATVALRAQPGSCASGGGTLQRTTDGGRTWATLKVPATSILRVRSTSPSSFWLVGTSKGCVPELYRTADAGKTWATEAGTKNAWHPLPVPASGVVPTQLHAPTGDVALPCAQGVGLVDLAGITLSDAVVLCADGTVFATADGGATWRARTAVPSSGALAAVSADRAVGGVGGPGRGVRRRAGVAVDGRRGDLAGRRVCRRGACVGRWGWPSPGRTGCCGTARPSGPPATVARPGCAPGRRP